MTGHRHRIRPDRATELDATPLPCGAILAVCLIVGSVILAACAFVGGLIYAALKLSLVLQ